jgi:WD40 repeat protein
LGSFNEPLKSQSESLTCCQFNDHHQLFVNGTNDGRVEAWDYRDKKSIATLDCVLNKAIAMEIDIDSKFVIGLTSLSHTTVEYILYLI